MFKIRFIFVLFLCLVSCERIENLGNASPCDEKSKEDEIVFRLESDEINIDVNPTKASSVSSLSSVYWYQVEDWGEFLAPLSGFGSNSKLAAVQSSKVYTGWYWPANTYPQYRFFGCNQIFSWDGSWCYISADNGLDVVACFTDVISYGSSFTMNLQHIFARTGTLVLTPPTGFSVVGTPQWFISSTGYSSSGIAGTYYIGKGWGTTATKGLDVQYFNSSSDLYLIPGYYNISIIYTLKKGNWQEEFTKNTTVYLTGNKINHISAVAPDVSVSEIVFSVSTDGWDTRTISTTLN